MLDAKKFPEFRYQENSLIFDGDYLDIYIPRASFDDGLARYNGNYINTIGIFFFEIIKASDLDKEGRKRVFHKMTFPNSIDFQYTDILSYKGSINGTPNIQYDVFRLEKGNQFIANVNYQKTSDTVITFVNKLHNGKMPKILTYEEILKMYHEVLALNEVSLKAPSLLYELVIAESCRDSKNLSRPYRLKLAKSGGSAASDPYGFVNIRINRLPQLNSTFAGLTFENMTDSVISSLERTLSGGKEQPSPIEDTIKY